MNVGSITLTRHNTQLYHQVRPRVNMRNRGTVCITVGSDTPRIPGIICTTPQIELLAN